MQNLNIIGKRLLMLRGSRKQKEIAEAIGVSQSAIVMYEKGQRMPRDEIKVKISKLFETPIEDIFFN